LKIIKTQYLEDSDFGKIYRILQDSNKPIPVNLRNKIQRFRLEEGCLLNITGEQSHLCIPQHAKTRLQPLQKVHDTPVLEHLGFEKTYKLLS
jgi:hypothetical protein